MKLKLLSYISIGIVFGFVDWFVQEGIGWLSKNIFWPDTPLMIPVILFLIYGVWLIPAFFVARHAARISNWFAAVSTSLMWVAAVLSYYVAYGVALLFYGLPHMDHLLWTNRNTPSFAEGWQTQFRPLLLAQVLEWLPIAIFGGLIIGFTIAAVLNRSLPTIRTAVRSFISICLLTFGLFAATPSTTYACSCIEPGTPAEEFDQTEAIFAGQVTAVDMISKTGFAPYEITLQVAESWKGVTEKEISVYTGLTGGTCAYGFVNGKHYLVYANQDSKTDKLIASMCSPTKLVDDATEDLAYLRANHEPLLNRESKNLFHTIQAGETIRSIALQYGTTTDEIIALNLLTDTTSLRVGRILRIPPATQNRGAEDKPSQTTPSCPDERAQIVSPKLHEKVSGTVEIVGTATHESFQFYKLEYVASAGTNTNFIYLGGGNEPVEEDVLTTFDSTAVADGIYGLRLIVVDQNGDFLPLCQLSMIVENEPNEATVYINDSSKTELHTFLQRYFGQSFIGMPERNVSILLAKLPEELPFNPQILAGYQVVGSVVQTGERAFSQIYLTAQTDVQTTLDVLEEKLEKIGFKQPPTVSPSPPFIPTPSAQRMVCNTDSNTVIHYSAFKRQSGLTELFIRIDESSPFNRVCEETSTPDANVHLRIMPRLKSPPNTTVRLGSDGHSDNESYSTAQLTSSLSVPELMAFYQEQLLDLDWEQIEISQTSKLGWSSWRFADEQGRHWNATVYLVRKAGTDIEYVITMRAQRVRFVQ